MEDGMRIVLILLCCKTAAQLKKAMLIRLLNSKIGHCTRKTKINS
jgi:hypothetical protein